MTSTALSHQERCPTREITTGTHLETLRVYEIAMKAISHNPAGKAAVPEKTPQLRALPARAAPADIKIVIQTAGQTPAEICPQKVLRITETIKGQVFKKRTADRNL